MASANPRGQCSIELVLVLIVATAAIFALHLTAVKSKSFFKPVMLSQEVRR
jgi:hypothetical protein